MIAELKATGVEPDWSAIRETWGDARATGRQLDYLEFLGVYADESITKREASELIEKAEGAQEARERIRPGPDWIECPNCFDTVPPGRRCVLSGGFLPQRTLVEVALEDGLLGLGRAIAGLWRAATGLLCRKRVACRHPAPPSSHDRIDVRCPHCGREYQVYPELAGLEFPCRFCDRKFRAPK